MTRTEERYFEKAQDALLNVLSEANKLLIYGKGVQVEGTTRGYKEDLEGELRKIMKTLNEYRKYAYTQLEEA